MVWQAAIVGRLVAWCCTSSIRWFRIEWADVLRPVLALLLLYVHHEARAVAVTQAVLLCPTHRLSDEPESFLIAQASGPGRAPHRAVALPSMRCRTTAGTC